MKNKFQSLICCFLMLTIDVAFCQTWESYNRSNSNMPSDNVTGLSVSENGTMWISTLSGLAKFDGQIQIHSIKNSGYTDEIINVWATSNDSIWVGTEFKGLWKFNGVSEWVHYHPGTTGNGIVGFGVDSKDTVWILDKFGNFEKWTGDSWEEIDNFFSHGNGLFIDSKDNIWLMSGNSGLEKYSNSQFIIDYDNTWNPDASDYIPDASIHDMVEDSEGNYWIGGNYSGLMKFDGNEYTVFTTENSGIASNKVRAIAIDENDVLWIGTWDNGISKFDGKSWVNYDLTNSALESLIINDIELGKDGKIWIANGYNEFISPSGGKGIFVFNEYNDLSGGNLPNSPSELSIQGISVHEVILSWSDNSSNEHGFIIQRSINDQDQFETLKYLANDQTSFTDLTVEPENIYYYRVYAVNSQGVSDFSNIESIIPKYCTVNKASYSCYSNVTNFTFGDIENSVFNERNGYYNYLDQVATVWPGQSIEMSITFDRFSITSDPIIGGEVYIDWNADGDFTDQDELIFQDLNINRKATFNLIIEVPEEATLGTTRIRTRTDDDTYNGISPCGYAEETQDYTLRIIEVPNVIVPSNLVAELRDSTSVVLTWNDNSPNEDFHHIYRSQDGNIFDHIASVEQNISVYIDEGLGRGVEYSYKISAVSSDSSSDFSETVIISTPAEPPLILSTENIVEAPFSVFPNPFDNRIFLDIPERKGVEVMIHDLNGRIIQQFEIQSNSKELDVSDMVSGIYVMKISTVDSEILMKIIKK